MSLSEVVMTLLRIVVSMVITGVLTVGVNMIWRHGSRWFRGARKFVRTGRWKSGPRARWQDSSTVLRSAQSGVRLPRLTLEDRVALLLAKMSGKNSLANTQVRPYSPPDEGNGEDLKLRF